jgi:hypothetical protein
VPLRQLRRVRWAVRASLVLGVAASVAANILHAEPNPIAQTISAWPPLALMLTVELISRVPVHRRSLSAVRLFATFAIAGIAAWVSYWHMAGVAAKYGESGAAPYLLPLSVDGLIIVASVSLVELAGRIRSAEEDSRERAEPAPAPAPSTPPVAHPATLRASDEGAERIMIGGPSSEVLHDGFTDLKPVRGAGVGALVGMPSSPGLNGHDTAGARRSPQATGLATHRVSALDNDTRLALSRITAPVSAVSGSSRPAPRVSAEVGRAMATVPAPAQRRGRPVAETRRLAAELTAQQPDVTAEDLARQLGITPKRLKSILAGSPAA